MNVVKTGLRSGRQGAEWLLLAALMPAGVMVGAEVQSVVVPAKAANVTAARPADVAASPEFAAMIGREMEATVKAFNAADPAGVGCCSQNDRKCDASGSWARAKSSASPMRSPRSNSSACRLVARTWPITDSCPPLVANINCACNAQR